LLITLKIFTKNLKQKPNKKKKENLANIFC